MASNPLRAPRFQFSGLVWRGLRGQGKSRLGEAWHDRRGETWPDTTGHGWARRGRLMLSRVQELKAQGLSIREIAEKVHIPKSTVARMLAVPQVSHAVPRTVPKVSQKIAIKPSKPALDESHAVPAVPQTVPEVSQDVPTCAAYFLDEFLQQKYGIEDLATDHLEIDPWTLRIS